MIANNRVPLIILITVLVAVVLAVLQVPNKQQQQTNGELSIQSWETGNGVRVLFVQARQLPMLDVRLVFDAGSARDGDKPGLARLTNGMLKLGAGEWDTDAIAERFEGVGAQFSTSALRDMAVVQLRSLTKADLLETAVKTLQAIIVSPNFEGQELARLRKQTLIALQNEEQNPGKIANRAFYARLYGEQPYASNPLGNGESVKAITREDLQAFHKRYYVSSNAIVAIVGDLNRDDAAQLAEELVGKLPAGESAAELQPVAELKDAQRVIKSHPSTQTHILVGQPGMKRGDADYFPLYVGNHILGGSGFGSRIVKEIREERGLAYSSYSYFVPMRVKGPFIMGLQTRNDQAQQALDLLDEILQKYIAEGPSPEELQHAKMNITGGFPLRIDSNRDIVEYIAMIGFYDLPLDYLQTFNSQIEAVTGEQIQDAFKRRVHPGALLTVTVGGGENGSGVKEGGNGENDSSKE